MFTPGRKHSLNGAAAAVALVLLLTVLFAVGAIPAARAAPTLVQQATGGGTGTSYTITLTGVATGDLIVVAEGEGSNFNCPCNTYPPSITDTQSNGYFQVDAVNTAYGTGLNVEASIWYAIATSSGTDTITVTLTGCAAYVSTHPGTACQNDAAVAYDLRGFTPAGAVGGTGTGASGDFCCSSSSSFTPTAGSFVVGTAGASHYTTGAWAAGTGFTLSGSAASPDEVQAEYLTGWSGGSTTAPMTGSGNFASVQIYWAYAAAAFAVEPVVTTTGTSTVTTTQTVIQTSTVTTTATSTRLTTTTVTTGSCAVSTYGPGIIRQDTLSTPSPTITDTDSTTVTTTATTTSTVAVTSTATTTATGTVTETTCTASTQTNTPTGVPQFPLAGLSALTLVALLLPALVLINRMRSARRAA